MFLRATKRFKDGKEHRYWNIVENRRCRGNRIVQKQVLYLGEINDSQHASWCKCIKVLNDEADRAEQVAIFPEDREAPALEHDVVQVKLSELSINRARQWGACWLAAELWNQLALDTFWQERLTTSRQGTRWLNVFKTLVSYRLIDPGSEWRLHRQWFDQSAMADLLGEDFSIAQKDKLYRCLDKLVEHKRAFFSFLQQRWKTLFDARFEVLLYDLTSTYFESEVPEEDGLRRFGYSRDKRPDCVQVVIALIVTPEGLPLAYEVMPGNTCDKTTLEDFLKRIEEQYGKSERVWVMDRGIPTEKTLQTMRQSDPPVFYLVGTPRGRLTKLETAFLNQPWAEARDRVEVKLLEKDDELYILAKSAGRVDKERAMRQRKLKRLWKRLHELQRQKLTRDQLLIKLGAAKKEAGKVYALVDITYPADNADLKTHGFQFSLRKDQLRKVRQREGRYLLRSNLAKQNPADLWNYYIQLTEVEQAFKELKSDLSIRPIYHQRDHRIEAHIFVAFVAYCLQVTLKYRTRALAPGLTPRAVLEKFAAIQMVDVHIPTTDGRCLVLPRYTQPEKELQLLLKQLDLTLPDQPPPKIKSRAELTA
ncbi:MAG: IS1634 family transposase [Halobacteria archaeon]|nr:IS1634 family transposase [Halobacteria archaeon]